MLPFCSGWIPISRFIEFVDASFELHNPSLRSLYQAQRLQSRLRIRSKESRAATEGLWRPGNGSNQRRRISFQVHILFCSSISSKDYFSNQTFFVLEMA